MSAEDGDDALVPLSRMRARLAGPRGVRRIDALLQAADPAAAVAALSVPELHQLVAEVGFADSAELIALATPEQVRGCVDIAAWERDRVQLSALAPWLAALVDAGYETLGRAWAALDSELTALLVARWARIHDLSLGEEPPEDDEAPLYRTPDGFFAILVDVEDEASQVLLLRLIEDLYRADADLARHTLMAARSEPLAELEEMGYRWRSGRMADLGYVPYEEALALFRPLDAAQVRIDEGTAAHPPAADDEPARTPGALPVPLAERLVGKSFLARAVDEVRDGDALSRLEAAFVLLGNQVLAALRIEPGDGDAVALGTDYAVATVALGLEMVSHGDLDAARAALGSVALSRLFRVGYGATLRLSGFARAIARRALSPGPASTALLGALGFERPFFPRELDQPPGTGPRPFESVADLRRAAHGLTELALRIAVAESLGADLAALAEQPEPRPELDDFARTALVRCIGGGPFDAGPLAPDELLRFRRDGFAGDRLGAPARGAAAAALDHHLDVADVTAGRDHLAALVAGWLDQLEDGFAGLDPAGEIDPRFVTGVITSSQRA